MDEQANYQATTEGSPRWMGIAVVGLAILSLVGVGLAWNAGGHARDAEQALATQTKTFQQSQDGITQRMAQAERTNAELQAEVNLVGDKLKLTDGSTCDGPQPGEAEPRRLHEKAERRAIHAGDKGQRG